MFFGLLDLSAWQMVAVTLIFTHITIAAVTIYLHRSQAHRAVDLHPVVSHFFRFWLWMTTGMVTWQWVALHRKHHAYSDKPGDPHSPVVYGLKKVFLEGAELYRTGSNEPGLREQYGHGTPDDWAERTFYHSSRNGIVLMLLVNVMLFGVYGITTWAVQMAWIPIFAAGVINGIGHFWGYRNYETGEASTNISPWGILIGGEELHNNHHAFPSSAKLSSKPWEFDIGWMYIKLMSYVGLAKVKKVAPKPIVDPSKSLVDLDTVRGVILNRLHVMSDYFDDVMLPVMREGMPATQLAQLNGKRRIKSLLVREDSRMDVADRRQLGTILERLPALKTVYEYRAELQSIWTRTAASHDELLAALQDWCKQAEETGIESLRSFAEQLRSYTTPASVTA